MTLNNDKNKDKTVLNIENGGYSIAGNRLLNNINIKLNSGEIVAIVGPNGAGKTTLLQAMAGDIALDNGNIQLLSKPIQQWPLKARARNLAVLPQFSLLNFPYTVEDVVSLGRMPHSTGIKVDTNIVTEVMHIMDITHLSQRIYLHLSGGEKQRTQLARVMAQIWLTKNNDSNNKLLLLDEPTASLDLGHQQALMKAIGLLSKEGVSIAMVLHDINLAARYCDRIIALLKGSIVTQGNIDNVLSSKLLTQLFGAKMHIIKHPTSQKNVVIP